MATIAELQDALVNADRAGDAAAARALADAIVAAQGVQEQKPFAVKAGEFIGDIGRQVGLTARYGIEGLGQTAQVVAEPFRLATQAISGKQVPAAGDMARQFADRIGLPSPQGANERVIGDAARIMAGGGGLNAVARGAAAAPGVIGAVANQMAAAPGAQIASMMGSGLAGGSAREAGLGPWEQFAASLGGGLAAPTAAASLSNAARSGVSMARQALSPATVQREVDSTIAVTLRQQGIDWATVPEAVKQPMREEVRRAMATGGQLNADAMRRLLDFRRVGATPTRGMLTQDPVQITAEKNLAKVGANSTDSGLQRLPQLEARNTETLLRNLDEAGAANAPDAYATGDALLRALNANVAASRGRIDSLYQAARDTSGRAAPIDANAFTRRANELLDDAMLGGSLPQGVANRMNQMATGQHPLDVQIAEQFKTQIGRLQRSANDGQTRMALGLVRQALDEAPLVGAPQVNPGNLPAVPGAVPPSPVGIGQESINAFNRARAANRAFMQRVEQTPALAAAIDGAQPDRFVQQFVIGGGSTVRDVQALRRAVANDPQALQAVRQNIAAHLRSAATNGTEDVNKFNAHSYNTALNNIGTRKLAAFFSPDEIARLQSVGRTGTLMTAQPAGTAVNNSNSGALLIGRGLSLLDSIAGKAPFGVDAFLQGMIRTPQQWRATNVPQALVQPEPDAAQRLLGPLLYGGLLATQPVNSR